MRLTKLGIGIIVALFVINAVTLSQILARQKSQYLPFTMTRIDYLSLKIEDYFNYYIGRWDFEAISLSLSPGSGNSDVVMKILWNRNRTPEIGESEKFLRDTLINLLEIELVRMHALKAWEPYPLITCIQVLKDDNEEVAVDKVERLVSTSD